MTVFPNVAEGRQASLEQRLFPSVIATWTRYSVNARPSVSLAGEVVWAGEAPDPPITSQLTFVLRPITRAPWSGETDAVRTSIPGQFSFKHLLVDEYGLQTFGSQRALTSETLRTVGEAYFANRYESVHRLVMAD